MKGIIGRLFGAQSKDQKVTYERAKELARDDDVAVRRKLARRGDLKPEILYFLAEDEDVGVRQIIAANVATPRHADLLLAEDADQDVRVGLAEKIALLAPGLTSHEQDTIRRMTYEALEILARDQMVRVRQILSETLKDIADAPPEVIQRLARDSELAVAAPILEFSPVLSTEDLLEIIASEPISGALSAVSRRRGLGEAVADAISASDDIDAITEMLGNDSAQIREETLNKLIGRAIDNEPWHKPLALRPMLPPGAAPKLARFVAHNMLEILTTRHDLDEEMAEAVRTIVERRLREEGPPAPSIAQDIYDQVKELEIANKLTDECINDAMQAGNNDFVTTALVVLSGLGEAVVAKAIATRNAKGIIAIGWKAKQPPWIVEQLQLRLCKIPTEDVLVAEEAGGYPMTREEMNWQINFISDLSG